MVDPEPLSVVAYATPVPRTGWASLPITALKFMLTMATCTIVCAILWQRCVTDVLYHCSDSLGFDYLQGPGGWVHGTVAGQPGSYGDTIRPGWSFGSLQGLWAITLATSAVVSLVLARMRWFSTSANDPG